MHLVTRSLHDLANAAYLTAMTSLVFSLLRSARLVWPDVRVRGRRVDWTTVTPVAFFSSFTLGGVGNLTQSHWMEAVTTLMVVGPLCLIAGIAGLIRLRRERHRMPGGKNPAVPVYRLVHGREEPVAKPD